MEYTIITFIGIIILVIYLLYNILKLKEQFVPSNSSDIIDDNKLEDFIKLEFDPIDTHIKFKPVSQNKDVNIDTEPILVNILNSIRNMDEFKKLNVKQINKCIKRDIIIDNSNATNYIMDLDVKDKDDSNYGEILLSIIIEGDGKITIDYMHNKQELINSTLHEINARKDNDLFFQIKNDLALLGSYITSANEMYVDASVNYS